MTQISNFSNTKYPPNSWLDFDKDADVILEVVGNPGMDWNWVEVKKKDDQETRGWMPLSYLRLANVPVQRDHLSVGLPLQLNKETMTYDGWETNEDGFRWKAKASWDKEADQPYG